MKNKFFICILSFLFLNTNFLFSQSINLCLGIDANVCPGQTVTINNCNNGNVGANGPYLNAPTQVSLSDDQWSNAVNIGFPFSFYGQNYTQCVIGSNGLISFNMANANGYCPWTLNGVGQLPNPGFAAAKNSIMLTYQDINPSLGGQIQYQSIGTAPNRRFVVLYKNIYMFSCTQQCNYMAIILYETTNVFELHIGNKPLCTTWNSGLAIQGSENNPGTLAHITPGRNNTQWSANQDGRRFTPTSPTNTATYTMLQIPYVIATSAGTNFAWSNTLGQTFPYNNGVLNVNPVPSGTTGYFLSATACNASLGSVTNDTTWLTTGGGSVNVSITNDICSQGVGTATANPGAGSPPYTFTWTPNVGNTQTISGLAAGTYNLTMVDANGCPYTGSGVVGDNPATYSFSSTLVSCPGGNDGTATAVMTPSAVGITYSWSNGQTTATATGLTAGTYTCIMNSPSGCTGTVSVVVTEIPGMILTTSNVIDANCNGISNGSATINVVQGTAPYFYQWSASNSILNSANNLGAGPHTIIVTDAAGCSDNISLSINEPSPLAISFVTQDSMICSESAINISAIGTGGSSPYIFTWTENGIPIGNGSTILVDPINSGTQYCISLTEQCGSPFHPLECLTISFPTPIIPIATPDDSKKCLPGDFIFSNTSLNGEEIATMNYTFSNGFTTNTTDLNSLSASFSYPGIYSLDLIVTSIYGCIYTSQIQNIIEVTPLPIADFTISKNPATWFETTIQTNDVSFGNISSYFWSSNGASNIVSNGDNAFISYPEGVVGNYEIYLKVIDSEGCMDSTMLTIEIVPDIIFYAPNSFTPDNDEHNQSWLFYIEGIDLVNFNLQIYNRWGEVIWETIDTKASWDGYFNGSLVQAGSYIWKASYKALDNDDKKQRIGLINVIR